MHTKLIRKDCTTCERDAVFGSTVPQTKNNLPQTTPDQAIQIHWGACHCHWCDRAAMCPFLIIFPILGTLVLVRNQGSLYIIVQFKLVLKPISLRLDLLLLLSIPHNHCLHLFQKAGPSIQKGQAVNRNCGGGNHA